MAPRNRQAFTLVEVLVVVVIVAIAGAVVVPSMMSPGKMHVQAAARMVIADLLIAQNEAIAKQAPRRVVFNTTNNSYQIEDQAGQIIVVNWKANAGSGNYIVDFDDDSRFRGVSLQNVDFGGGAVIEFDVLGGPSTGGSLQLQADGATYVITVSPLTGRVTVAPI